MVRRTGERVFMLLLMIIATMLPMPSANAIALMTTMAASSYLSPS
jgi:hypothetical protein